MPPRKSDVSKAGTGDEATLAKEGKELPIREGVNIEDLNLPKSIVTRLAKGVLPPNTQIQGNAMLAMTKSATVFVNYLATNANENTQSQGRKTIAPQDVFKALEDIEFPEFIPRLEAELAKFNEIATFKRNQYRSRVAADKAAGKAVEGHEADDAIGEGHADKDGQPAAKKARRDPSAEAEEDAAELRGVSAEQSAELEEEEEDEEQHAEGNGDDTEVEDDEDEHDEHLDPEERLEELEEREVEDEALDNGEDSD